MCAGKAGGEIASPASNRRAIKSMATSGSTLTAGAAKSVRGVGEGATVSVDAGPWWSWPHGAGVALMRIAIEAA